MSVLFFSSEMKGRLKELLRVIETDVPEEEIEVYSNLEDLIQKLRRPRRNLAVIILAAVAAQELERLLLIQDLFDDLPVLLILPDSDPETLFTGQKFFPRFVTDMEGDLSEIVLVLNHLLERSGR